MNVLNLNAILGFQTKGADGVIAQAEKVTKSIGGIGRIQESVAASSDKSSAKLVQLQARYKEAVDRLNEFDAAVVKQTKHVQASGLSMDDAQNRIKSLIATIDNNKLAMKALGDEQAKARETISSLNLEMALNRDLTEDDKKAKTELVDAAKAHIKATKEEVANLKAHNKETEEEIAKAQSIVEIRGQLAQTDRVRIDLMANVESASNAVSREQTRLNSTLKKSAPIFNASAAQLSQWVQMVRTGNVTQGLFTQSIQKMSAVLSKIPFIGVAAGAAFTALALAGFQAWRQIEALRKEMENLDVAARNLIGLSGALIGDWGDLADEFSASERQLNRTAFEYTKFLAGLGVTPQVIQSILPDIQEIGLALSEAFSPGGSRANIDEWTRAVQDFVGGNEGAFKRFGLVVADSGDIIERAKERSGALFEAQLSETDKVLAAIDILMEESARAQAVHAGNTKASIDGIVDYWVQAWLSAPTGSIDDLVATANELGRGGVTADLFGGLEGLGVEEQAAAAKEILRVYDAQVSRLNAVAAAHDAVAAAAARKAKIEKDAAEFAVQVGPQYANSVLGIVNAYAQLGEEASGANQMALFDSIQEVIGLGDEAAAVFTNYAKQVLASGEASAETEQYLTDLLAVLEDLKDGTLDNLDPLNRLAAGMDGVSESAQSLTGIGYSAIDAFRNLADAMAEAERNSNPESTLAVARAWEQVMNITGDVEGGIGAVVEQLDYLQQAGFISAAAGDALRASLGYLDPLVRSTGKGMSGTGGDAYYMAGGFGTAALKGAELAAALAAVGIAANLLPGGEEGEIIGNRALFAAQLREIKAALGSFTSGFGSAFSGVGSSASAAASQVATAADIMSGALNAAIGEINAVFRLEDAQDDLEDLKELAVSLPDDIATANENWLSSVDALTEAQARLVEEQQKSLEVTNAEQVAIERLEDRLFLAQRAYEQGTISAAELALIQENLNEAVADSTLPTGAEDAAAREVERLTSEVERTAEYMNDLKDRQAGIAREIERAELSVLAAALSQVEAYQNMVEAQAALKGLTAGQLADWKGIASAAGLTAEMIGKLTGFAGAGSLGGGTGPGGIPGAGGEQYTVKAGDSLSKIAAAFNFPDWQALWDLNPQIVDPNLIFPGQVINVSQAQEIVGALEATTDALTSLPSLDSPVNPDGLAPLGSVDSYTVQSGDTLSKIAAQFGFPDWQTLYEQNSQIANPNLITPGQEINITVNSVFPVDEQMAAKTVDAIQTVMDEKAQAAS